MARGGTRSTGRPRALPASRTQSHQRRFSTCFFAYPPLRGERYATPMQGAPSRGSRFTAWADGLDWRRSSKRRGFEEMHIRLLLIGSVLCIATYGCETTPTDPKAAAAPREEPTYTTGSRLPSSGSATVQGASRGAWKTIAETPPAAQALWGDDAHRSLTLIRMLRPLSGAQRFLPGLAAVPGW